MSRFQLGAVCSAIFLLLVSFQNCAVQQSEDRKNLDSTLGALLVPQTNCLPFLSQDMAVLIFDNDFTVSSKQVNDGQHDFACLISSQKDNQAGLNTASCYVDPSVLKSLNTILIPSGTTTASTDSSKWTWPSNASASERGALTLELAKNISGSGVWYEMDVVNANNKVIKKIVNGLGANSNSKEGILCQFVFSDPTEWSDAAAWTTKEQTAVKRLQGLISNMVSAPLGF